MKENSPSATAYLIARSTLFLSRDPHAGCLVPQRAAELSKLFIKGRRRATRWLDRITSLGPLAGLLERYTIPGIKLHYALRKRFLEQAARDAINNGVGQVVIIGAGFDTLALRLHESFPAVAFFEIDHPATQSAKRRVVESKAHSNCNLRFISLDLARGSLQDSLLSNDGYRSNEKTLFIAEGLLMYLAQPDIDRIFQFIRQVPGSRFAFTFMQIQGDGRIGFANSSRAVDAWLKLRGERFKWGIETSQLPEFLSARGFEPVCIATSTDLRKSYLTTVTLRNRVLAEGECICVAESR
ncbi:MAG: hypothetical protein QOJ64_3709 [Acidobacteriota bacterium]|jgi:methyltransferase (TIGR00027 family)|nr:hypothetical protein [Acidobacteriota bacterium]